LWGRAQSHSERETFQSIDAHLEPPRLPAIITLGADLARGFTKNTFLIHFRRIDSRPMSPDRISQNNSFQVSGHKGIENNNGILFSQQREKPPHP
jgi:hypothetical protein